MFTMLGLNNGKHCVGGNYVLNLLHFYVLPDVVLVTISSERSGRFKPFLKLKFLRQFVSQGNLSQTDDIARNYVSL